MPDKVVSRMFDLAARNDWRARSALYDSVYYVQDLMVPPLGNPARPAAVSPEERARRWSTPGKTRDPLPARHREVLQHMVAGRFVVVHVAVLFDPPHQGKSFDKLEIYEVRNGRIVAEYDGQDLGSALGR
jgi:hypothetical protein